MLLAHKIELRPTEEQKEYLNKCCGTVRHCYNQLLERFSEKENPFSLQAANAFIEKYVLLLNGILKLRTAFLKMQFKIYSVLSVISFVGLKRGEARFSSVQEKRR